MELNVKLLENGSDFYLEPKIIDLRGEKLTIDQVEKVCSKLSSFWGIGSTPYKLDGTQQILVNSNINLADKKINVDNWTIELIDNSRKIRIDFRTNSDMDLIMKLLKRSLFAHLNRNTSFWRISESPRIFYEEKAFTYERDIDSYRRFELNDVLLDSHGLGYSVDIGTAFITQKDVEWYHRNDQVRRFDILRQRQNDRKGTLIYHGPDGITPCYFDKYYPNLTLETAPSFNIGSAKFQSPFDYYQKARPQFEVSPQDIPAKVNFRGLDHAVYVPANRLFLRVFNDVLPRSLKNVDKISPADRKGYLEENFWPKLGENPFGNRIFKFRKNYFIPDRSNSGIIDLCNIYFGENAVLPAPSTKNKTSYKEHYGNVKKYLENFGCYHVPPILAGSKIYFTFPENVPDYVRSRYHNDIFNRINLYLKADFEIESVVLPSYNHYLQATVSLNKDYEKGMVVFIFDNEDSATYARIDHELKEWKLKRGTASEMLRKYEYIIEGNGNSKEWDSYVDMTALDIIQQMGCIPFVVDPGRLNYNMQMLIDVSEDWTHFSLSLQIFKSGMPIPIFRCNTHRKADSKFESINPEILKDEFINLMQQAKPYILKYKASSLLAKRDGNNCKGELTAILEGIKLLQSPSYGILSQDFAFDFVEYHKTSRKGLRLWHSYFDKTTNVLEGAFSVLNGNYAVMATTGDGTLSQGTADPIIIVGGFTNGDFRKILNDIFISSQFNFSNPRVAQKLTLIAKRADEELTEKRAQEIKLKN
jgi:hypothetical protein